VHGDRDPHESGARYLSGVELLDRDIERIGSIPRPFEEPERRGQGQRLMAQLIAGDQENGALLSE
jgi:phage FluMu protein gp41